VVVGLSGRVGSGKSSLAACQAERSGWLRAAFGDYVRELARLRGLRHEDRQVLQAIGLAEIAKGWGPFCSAVLSHAGWEPGTSLIVEGIRHREAAETIREITHPDKFLLVYLAAEDDLIAARLKIRGKDVGSLGEIEVHATESQTRDELPRVADLVLDASRPLEELARTVLDLLARIRRAKGSTAA
jgi:dephospho-CoA kinase